MIWGSLRRAYFSSELSVTASVIVIRNIHFLQAVAIEVPFDRILNGVGALEEFGTFLLLVSAAVGIQVFIEEFPHIIRQAEDFQIFGISKIIIIIKYFKNQIHFSICTSYMNVYIVHHTSENRSLCSTFKCSRETFQTYWNPFLNFLAIPPKYSGSLMTSQINRFWQSRSL